MVGNQLLMFGGYSLQQRQFYNDIVAFDFGLPGLCHMVAKTSFAQQRPRSGVSLMSLVRPRSGHCNRSCLQQSKRRAHSCTVMAGGMLVIFGGYNGDYCLNDVHTFDSRVLSKTPLPLSPPSVSIAYLYLNTRGGGKPPPLIRNRFLIRGCQAFGLGGFLHVGGFS